jgi:hypothetical protein
MTLGDARREAERLLDGVSGWLIHDERTLEREWGWVFFWGQRDDAIAVVGGGPIAVLRHAGAAWFLGTAREPLALIAEFESHLAESGYSRTCPECGGEARTVYPFNPVLERCERCGWEQTAIVTPSIPFWLSPREYWIEWADPAGPSNAEVIGLRAVVPELAAVPLLELRDRLKGTARWPLGTQIDAERLGMECDRRGLRLRWRNVPQD